MRFLFLAFLIVATFSAKAEPRAFITNQLDNSVTVLGLHSLKRLATISVTGKPAGVAINDSKNHVYISTPESGGFTVIDSRQFTIVKTVKLAGATLGITVDHKGQTIFVADWYENTVTLFDANTF